MYRNLLKKSKSNKGFTLIELIVVIAIIAILALILVPRFAGFTNTAAERTNQSNRRSLETAVNVLTSEGKLGGTGSFTVGTNTACAGLTGSLTWNGSAITDPTTHLQPALITLVGDRLTPQGGVATYTVTVDANHITVENTTPAAPGP